MGGISTPKASLGGMEERCFRGSEVAGHAGHAGNVPLCPVVRFLLRKLVDAGRVRVRHTKPAPRYALCDDLGGDAYATHTPPKTDEEEPAKSTYGTYGTYGAYGAYGAYGTENDKPVSGVSDESESHLRPKTPVNTQTYTSPVSGVSGVSDVSDEAVSGWSGGSQGSLGSLGSHHPTPREILAVRNSIDTLEMTPLTPLTPQTPPISCANCRFSVPTPSGVNCQKNRKNILNPATDHCDNHLPRGVIENVAGMLQ